MTEIQPNVFNNKGDSRLETVRKNLRVAVAIRETNFSEVSRQAGMSRNGLGQFLKGRTNLAYHNMLKVCDVLDIPIGLLHLPDAITQQRLRVHKNLDAVPLHVADEALKILVI